MELTLKKIIMNISIMRSDLSKYSRITILIYLLGCKTQNFKITDHKGSKNCQFKNYTEIELNEIDSNYDKALLLRTNFCGSELCSNELYKTMQHYVKNEKKRVLIIVNINDIDLIKILSKNKQIKVRIDQAENYLKYGFQRPGHYAFVYNNSSCPAQFTNITQSFILWFEKQ